MCTETKAPNLVIVEGGPKGIKRFIKLMTKRIKWNVKAVDKNDNKNQESESESESDDDDDDNNNNNNTNSANNSSLCQLLWQGCQAKRTFSGFRFQGIKITLILIMTMNNTYN
jgi:U4/U6 small nuclear ribonucleoprotein PRP3